MPGTINHKTGKLAEVVKHHPEGRYALENFPQAEINEGVGKQPAEGRKFRQVLAVVTSIDLGSLPISNAMKSVIRTGKYPNQPERYPTRSEAVFAVLVHLTERGCSEETMQAVMLNADLPIGEHVREHSNPARYLRRQIDRARARVNSLEQDGPPWRNPGAWQSDTPRRIALKRQCKELRLLHAARRINVRFEDWLVQRGVDLEVRYDAVDLGERVGLAVE